MRPIPGIVVTLLLVPEQTAGNVGGRCNIQRTTNPVLFILLVNRLVFAIIANNIHAIELHHVSVKTNNLCIVWETHFQSERYFGNSNATQAGSQAVTHCSPRLIIRLQEVLSIGKEILCEIPNVFGANIVHPATRFLKRVAESVLVENPLSEILDGIVTTDITFPSGMDTGEGKQPASKNLIVGFRLDGLPIVGVTIDGVSSHVGEDGIKCRGVHTSIETD